MAAKKWLLIVLDGDATMGPHWPTIVSEYLQKIVRRFCGNSQPGEGVSTAVCEVGLVMYNANSDLGCDMQFMHWTKEVDEFLKRLPYLAFNGDGINPSAVAEGLAEALLMYPKPSPGTPTTEYYNGERHCILVGASDPFPGKMTMAVPKIREGEFVGTEVDICKADYRSVAQMFTPLAVSLSVISPKQLPVWTEIFNLGNNILEIAGTDPVTNSSGRFIVLLPENLREAQVEPKETTTNVALPSYSIPSDDSEDWFLEGQIAKENTVAQQMNGSAITELESLVNSVEWQPVATQNQNAMDQTQVASSSPLSPLTLYDINNIMAELNADNDDIVLPWNKPTRTYITSEEYDLSELFHPNQLMSPFDDIGNSLDPQQSIGNSFDPQQSIGNSFDPQQSIGNSLDPQQSMFTEKKVSNEGLLEIQAELEQALLDAPLYISKGQTPITASTDDAFEQALLATPENVSEAKTSTTTFTDNSSKAVISSPLVEPKAPNTGIWSSMLQTLGGNSSMNVLNHPTNNAWTSAASALLPSSSSQPTGLQAKHVGAQGTSGIMKSDAILQGTNARGTQIIPTRGVFSLAPHAMSTSSIMKTDAMLQGTSARPVGAAFGSMASHAMTNSHVQPSSLSRTQISPYMSSPLTSISGLQNLSGYKRDLMNAFGSPTPTAGASTFIPSTGMFQRTHTPLLLLPSVPMEHQPDYVKSWEGAISGILQNSTICYNEARAYRKITARDTLTVQWPRWLQINRTLRQSIVNNSMSIYRGPVDHVVIEILMSNNNDLHECLRSRDFCAKLILPSQTLFLFPTNDPKRFIGTILQGRQDFTTLQFTHTSSSRASKAARLTK